MDMQRREEVKTVQSGRSGIIYALYQRMGTRVEEVLKNVRHPETIDLMEQLDFKLEGQETQRLRQLVWEAQEAEECEKVADLKKFLEDRFRMRGGEMVPQDARSPKEQDEMERRWQLSEEIGPIFQSSILGDGSVDLVRHFETRLRIMSDAKREWVRETVKKFFPPETPVEQMKEEACTEEECEEGCDDMPDLQDCRFSEESPEQRACEACNVPRLVSAPQCGLEMRSGEMKYVVALAHRYPQRRLVFKCATDEMKFILEDCRHWRLHPYFIWPESASDGLRDQQGRPVRTIEVEQPGDIFVNLLGHPFDKPKAKVWMVRGYPRYSGYVHYLKYRGRPRLWVSSERTLPFVLSKSVRYAAGDFPGYYVCQSVSSQRGIETGRFPKELVIRCNESFLRVNIPDRAEFHLTEPGLFRWILAHLEDVGEGDLWAEVPDMPNLEPHVRFYVNLCRRYAWPLDAWELGSLRDAIERDWVQSNVHDREGLAYP